MTELTSQQVAVIQKNSELAKVLYEVLDSDDSQRILSAQQNLSEVVEAVKAHIETDANISRQEEAILRQLAGAAIKELPQKIHDPANYSKIEQDLGLLKSSLVLL